MFWVGFEFFSVFYFCFSMVSNDNLEIYAFKFLDDRLEYS